MFLSDTSSKIGILLLKERLQFSYTILIYIFFYILYYMIYFLRYEIWPQWNFTKFFGHIKLESIPFPYTIVWNNT